VEISERFRGANWLHVFSSRHPAVATRLDALSDHRGTAAAELDETDVRKVLGGNAVRDAEELAEV